MRVKILPNLSRWGRSLEIAVVLDNCCDPASALMAITADEENFIPVSQGQELPVAFTMSLEAGQALMDALWDCGLRPSDGKGSAGAMAAVQEHLRDLRKLIDRDDQVLHRLLDLIGGRRIGEN